MLDRGVQGIDGIVGGGDLLRDGSIVLLQGTEHPFEGRHGEPAEFEGVRPQGGQLSMGFRTRHPPLLHRDSGCAINASQGHRSRSRVAFAQATA